MKKLFFLLIFVINLGIIFYFWLLSSGSFFTSGTPGILIALGRISGLIAVYLILWQLVLIGRVKFLEQTFGFDRLALFHHFNGLFAWIFIFLHPVFLLLGYAQVNQVSLFSQTLDFLFNWENLAVAYLAVIIFIIVIILSLGAIQKKLKYETWYFVHLLTYLAIIWAFGHQLELGYDLQNKIFAAYWVLLYFLTVGPLIIFRFLKPVYTFYLHRFYVDRIIMESEQVASIYIKGRNLEKFNFRPGQFIIIRFLDKRLVLEAHPFSFSQGHNGRELRLTIKNLGDYTKALPGLLKVNTPAIIDGPHGIFTTKRTKNTKLVLVAGGIGITPLRAIAEEAGEKDIILLYAAPRQSDLIFVEEFKKMENLSLKVKYILSNENNYSGESGRADEESISRLVPDFLERDFYLCGPPLMLKSLRQSLKKLGVSNKHIYFEKFSLS